MSPPSPMHLQFAYYQSGLVVEFLVERFGIGVHQGDSGGPGHRRGDQRRHRETRRGRSTKIEKEFDAFARKRAEGLAPGVDWEQPPREQLDPADPQAVAQWLDKHPTNFWALSLHARNLVADEKWEEAKAPLKKLISAVSRSRR